MCYYAAESVTEEIMEIYSVIQSIKDEESYQNPSNILNTVFQRLDYLIAQDICAKRAEEFIYNPGFDSAFDAITCFRSLYTAKIEVLCRLYGLRGVGIEQEPDRAKLSRMVLQKLGLSDRIKIIAGNHFSLPLEEKSELIMVAAQAEPKKAIFDHLANVLPAGTKVSYRIKLYFSPSAKKRYGLFAILYDKGLFLVSNALSFSRLFTDIFFNPTSVNRSTTSFGVIPLKKGN